MRPYVPRPLIDESVTRATGSGSGVYALEGPSGAGKSTALLHALGQESLSRGKAGRGYVRLVQLWGDEPPSLFARRLVREASHLHLTSYPQPETLRVLLESMAHAVPGLLPAGKLLAALIPDDLRPLPQVAQEALKEIGDQSVARGGPLVIGVDLLGGAVSEPTRNFFTALVADLPPTVVILLAQPGGDNALCRVPASHRILLGPWTPAEALTYVSEVLGPLDDPARRLVESGRVSLLPGDLTQLPDISSHLRIQSSQSSPSQVLLALADRLSQGIVARYRETFESHAERATGDPHAAELCAWVALSARPEQPLTASDAVRRLGHLAQPTAPGNAQPAAQPIGLWRLRRSELVQALCVTASSLAPSAGTGPQAPDTGWPLLPRHPQARDGILAALDRHGVLTLYQQRFHDELVDTLRTSPGATGLLAGIRAFGLLLEQSAAPAAIPATLGQAVALLAEMELPLWHAGWHRSFADLYDALLPHLQRAGVSFRDVAPKLFFRRARARIQGVDWSGQLAQQELPLAIESLTELIGTFDPADLAIMQARLALSLPAAGKEAGEWQRQLPHKARQARGYARVLHLLTSPQQTAETRQAALDDILQALSHFAASQNDQRENLAQTLTILADWYSSGPATHDPLALAHYHQAIALSRAIDPQPTFSLGIIYRSLGRHHRRQGRPTEAAAAFDEARRWLLRGPDSCMGSLLSALLSG